MASNIKLPVVSIDEKNDTVTVNIERIDIGMSGFIVHKIAPNHTSILKNVTVVAFDKDTQMATLKMTPYNNLRNNSLPSGKWKVAVGDDVELAFGYSRALLITPSEEIYHRISKAVNVQWIHPDLFATILSFRGHPTPLKEDFDAMSISTSVGLLYIYLEQNLYTIDIRSFKILGITDAPLTQDSVKLPFYSRVENIDANWFGEGSSELESYEPYYYELLDRYNKDNVEFQNILKQKQGNKDDR
jgi:hypothetical protein